MENKNTIVLSKDGSHTLYNSVFKESYHSNFGAIQESEHIFLEAALKPVADVHNSINIFEVGFGTGLNALLTYKVALENAIKINYISVEAYPVDINTVNVLNYCEITGIDKSVFRKMHSIKNSAFAISKNFNLTVFHGILQDTVLPADYFEVVYFDAFSPETQPEMWRKSCFEKIYKSMRAGGVLTTYSCKGVVKRALISAGFMIEKLPGPPGKREFLRAVKA